MKKESSAHKLLNSLELYWRSEWNCSIHLKFQWGWSKVVDQLTAYKVIFHLSQYPFQYLRETAWFAATSDRSPEKVEAAALQNFTSSDSINGLRFDIGKRRVQNAMNLHASFLRMLDNELCKKSNPTILLLLRSCSQQPT